MSGEVNVCQPENLPFYPEYQKTISERDALYDEIKSLKVKTKEAQSGIEAAETEIQARTKQNASYQTQIANLTKANKALCSNPRQAQLCRQNRAQIAKLETEIKDNNKKITDFKKTKAQLEKTLKEYEKQYTKLDTARLEKIVKIEAFEKQIEEACKSPVISGEVKYRMATWECHDESQARYKDVYSCTDVQAWKSFSEVSCQHKCSKETGKCGVNRLAYDEKCDIQIPAVCGNGIREGNEQCDDGNQNDGDSCSKYCSFIGTCGNGIREGSEQCDDGNVNNGDGCDSTCGQENGALYFSAAINLVNLGIIDDFSAEPIKYRLADFLIRYDAVRAAAKTIGGILENESSYMCTGLFTDIGKNRPMCATAELALNAGIISGSSIFRPDAKLTRFEGISLALRSVGFKNISSLSQTEIIQLAIDVKMIENKEGFALNGAVTRGEFFYYLSQGLQAQEQTGMCDVVPGLCGG